MPHIHEKIDYCSEVYIVHKNKVLLRKHDKFHIWLSVGGHVELDEDPNEAAIREVKEEVGLDVKLVPNAPHGTFEDATELILPRAFIRHNVNAVHEHLVLVFFATSGTDKIQEGAGEQRNACRWFTREELFDKQFDVKPRIARLAAMALDELTE